MKRYKYSIELALVDGCNLESASMEFTRALEFPKKLFKENLEFMTLNYNEEEREKAVENCQLLNQELQKFGFKQVEFHIKEL